MPEKTLPQKGDLSGFAVNVVETLTAYEFCCRGAVLGSRPYGGLMTQWLALHPWDAWVDPNIATRPHPYSFVPEEGDGVPSLIEFLDGVVKQNRRYAIAFSWDGPDALGYCMALRRDASGSLVLCDPMTGSFFSGEHLASFLSHARLFSGGKADTVDLVRLDNKQVNAPIAMEAVEKVEDRARGKQTDRWATLRVRKRGETPGEAALLCAREAGFDGVAYLRKKWQGKPVWRVTMGSRGGMRQCLCYPFLVAVEKEYALLLPWKELYGYWNLVPDSLSAHPLLDSLGSGCFEMPGHFQGK